MHNLIGQFEKVRTPFYYYDTELLRSTLRTINDEAGKHEGFKVHYAVKANANPKLLTTTPSNCQSCFNILLSSMAL